MVLLIEKTFEISLLYDFYGDLLTPRQRNILQYYYEDNYTLGEIAEEINVSRQAVYDAVHKAERALHSYEEKLGLLKRFRQRSEEIKRAEETVDSIIAEYGGDAGLAGKLAAVKRILNGLEE